MMKSQVIYRIHLSSKENVRIEFMIAAMNDLDVLAADIGNAYVNEKLRERDQ